MTVELHALPSDSAFPEGEGWLALAEAQTDEQLCAAWLGVLCLSLVSARAGVVLLAQADGSYAPVATLPDGRDVSYLADIATDALRQREGIVRHDELGHASLAYPLQTSAREQAGRTVPGKVHGAVVLDLGLADEAALERALRLTHWGAGWLLDLLHQRELAEERQRALQAGACSVASVRCLSAKACPACSPVPAPFTNPKAHALTIGAWPVRCMPLVFDRAS